jgi:hypothetical protein
LLLGRELRRGPEESLQNLIQAAEAQGYDADRAI